MFAIWLYKKFYKSLFVIMNHIYTFFAIMLSHIAFSQSLGRQTFSSIGSSTTTRSGYSVSQSIGQQSAVVGSYARSNVSIQQGFQQGRYFQSTGSNAEVVENKIIKVHPNPITNDVNFEFSYPINGDVEISIWDMLGKQVFIGKASGADGTTVTVNDLAGIPQGQYTVLLKDQSNAYVAKILKK